MFRSIAVTTDLSDVSRMAFEPAAALARKLGGRLVVLHVDTGPMIQTSWQCASESTEAAARRAAELEQKLRELVRGESSFRGLDVVPRIVKDGADGSLDFADEMGLDLIVICSRAHEDVKHFIPGSFAARVLHQARCPILVLCATESRKRARPFDPRTILVPHDFSDSSRAALDVAAVIARKFRAAVEIVSIVEPKDEQSNHSVGLESGAAERLEQEMSETLERLRSATRGGWEDSRIHVNVRAGKPAAEVLKEAEASGADLIVMGSRGLSPVEQLSLGSVTASTIQNARCPVLVVKAEGKRPLEKQLSTSRAPNELS